MEIVNRPGVKDSVAQASLPVRSSLLLKEAKPGKSEKSLFFINESRLVEPESIPTICLLFEAKPVFWCFLITEAK
jgi:hypothetical protein